jgi:hypothetical protein
MSTISQEANVSNTITTSALDMDSKEFISREAQTESPKTWEGRKWAFLGSGANIPMFTHRLCATASAAFDSIRWGFEVLGKVGLQTAQGALLHGTHLLEGTRRLVEYTGFINLAYRTATEGALHFVAKDKADNGEERINWAQTAANTCFVAMNVLLPFEFVSSRLSAGLIGQSKNVSDLQNFVNRGVPKTNIFNVIASFWALGTGINFLISTKNLAQSVLSAVQEEKKNNQEYTIQDLIKAGWNKGATWSKLNDLQLKFVDFGASCFAGGVIPFPAGSLTKSCGLAFKAMSGINGVTQIFLGNKIESPETT